MTLRGGTSHSVMKTTVKPNDILYQVASLWQVCQRQKLHASRDRNSARKAVPLPAMGLHWSCLLRDEKLSAEAGITLDNVAFNGSSMKMASLPYPEGDEPSCELFFLDEVSCLAIYKDVDTYVDTYVDNLILADASQVTRYCRMSQKATVSDSDEEQDILQFKLVILGDGAVGKTSLSTRFSEDSFAKR